MVAVTDILFFPFGVLLVVLDLLTTLITFGWIGIIRKYSSSQEVSRRSNPVNGDESHRVHPSNTADNLHTAQREGFETLYELAQHAFSTFPNHNCLGAREFMGHYKGNPKVKQFNGNNVSWRSYTQVSEEAHRFGAALCAAGMYGAPATTSLSKIPRICRMAIFENSCPEWMIAALGAFSQSVSVVTIYSTLGINAVTDIVVDNRVAVILCNIRSVQTLVDKSNERPTLKTIVYTNDLVGPDDHFEVPKAPEGVTIVSFDDFVRSGDPQAYPPLPPKPDTTAVVMYTSGSTGKPKGVVIGHAAVVAAVASAKCFLTPAGRECPIRPGEETHLAYLPLAHIFEMMLEFFALYVGAEIGYADHKSLSPTGAYPTSALQCFRPTFLAGVPKVWDTMKKTAEGKILDRTILGQYLVKVAFAARKFALQHGYDTPLIKKLVFSRFQANVGGRMRYGVSGGGPLNQKVEEFCRIGFCAQMVQGYGLTETSAALTGQDLDDVRYGIVGGPVPGVEIKLESCPDFKDKAGQSYYNTDRLDVEGNPIWGRGEIVCRGSPLSAGYYLLPDVTKEVFEEGGWFHTGDIGQFTRDGSVQIIDRKKNLVKLKGGEYIALEQMEMTYSNCTFVDSVNGGLCCYGDGDMDRPVALIQVRERAANDWAKQHGMGDADFETLLQSAELNEAVLKDMESEFSKSDLSHLEKLSAVALLASPWTPENQCLTSANKLNRNFILRQYEDVVSNLKPKGIRA